MEVSSPQDVLQRSLGQVGRAVATKSTFPVLSNVLIEAEEDHVKLAATNQEIGISARVPAQVKEAGRITVDARLLSEFVNTLPNDVVTLSVAPGRFVLRVSSQAANAEINGIDAEEFPRFPRFDSADTVAEVDPQTLRDMVAQVEFAAASDDSRPVLAGVLMRFEENRLTLAAADGFRLAVSEGELAKPVSDRIDVIVPAKALRELGRILADRTEPIELTVTPNRAQLLVQTEGVEFYSRLIDGTFPDFRQIIPRDFATRIELGRDDFLAGVRRAGFFARDNNDVVRIQAHAGEEELMPGRVEVSATAAERGNSQSELTALIVGPDGQIAFNSRYLLDVLGVLKSSRVAVGMNGPNQAGVVRPSESDRYTYVIMPMVIGSQ